MSEETLEELYLCLKSEIKDDSDVKGIYNILKKELDINLVKSVNWWKKILKNYDIKEKRKDIDFLPLIRDYPILLIKRKNIRYFKEVLEEIDGESSFIIMANVFNIYDNLAIINVIRDRISKNDSKVLELIDEIREEGIREDIFNYDIFLREVMRLYIDLKYIKKEMLLKIVNKGSNIKERALLKALIIDYI